MDEQRMQAYVGLIEQLLDCAQGEEAALLQANAELLDAGLVEVMGQYADWLESQGSGNAQWLRGFAAQLAAAIGLEATASQGAEAARQFLLEILQLIVEKQGNPQQIYPLWAPQQARFNADLLAVLPTVAAQLLQGDAEQRAFITAVLVNFGNLMQQFPLGTRWLNLELGIAAYEQSLQVMTRETLPIEWATSMNNLAIAYKDRIRGNRAQNIEDAITAYQDSLEIFTPELLPHDCRKSARSLANLLSDQQRWQEAESIYQMALDAAETLYQSANLLDSKSAELTATADLPRRATYALARTGKLQKAIEILEQGRARGLSESLDRDRADLTQLQQTHPNLYDQYQAVTLQLRTLESQQRDRMASDDRQALTPETLRDTALALRQQLTDVLQTIRQVSGYEQFLALPTFVDIQTAVQANRPLVYLVSTPAGSLALIVTPNTVESVWLDALNETQLIDLLNQTWFSAYNQSRTNRQGWFDAIDVVIRQLWDSLMEPLVQQIKKLGFNHITLIPTGYLSLLPLHAAWTEDKSKPTGRRYAIDDLHITYAPNAKSLTAAMAIAHRPRTDSMLAINDPTYDPEDPTHNLKSAQPEVQTAIASFRDRSTVLKHSDATIEAVKLKLSEATIVHFACHGKAELADPLTSGLEMSDGRITLKDIFALNLAERGGLRLAILSACETGIIGLENADEAISLPTGLLQAGVAAVIASVWAVSDLSTMMLLTRFYDLWRIEWLAMDHALRQAQQWIRDTTSQQKAQYFKEANPDIFQALILLPPHYFSHPFHWAAFSYVGV